MMKTLTKSLLASVALSSSLMATDVGFYAGGGLAFEAVPDVNNLKMGLGIVMRGGMTLDALLENFAVEAELTKSLLDPKFERTGADDKINVTTLATYAVYRINVVDDFYVKPRFGIIFPNLGDDFVNSRDVTFSSGIGGGYSVMENLDVYIDYTVLGEGVTNYGAGVEYHF